jgi:GNAT superfamily N-acetyltransferase
MEVKILRAGDDDVLATVAPDVFDDAIEPRAVADFLADPRHHLAVAIEAGAVVGFVSAVHYVHPDKPAPELWINEVGVASTQRGRKVATHLLGALLDHARALGCTEAWVLTDRGNHAAMRTYAAAGGVEESPDAVMFTFRLGGTKP